jgi:acetyl esterase
MGRDPEYLAFARQVAAATAATAALDVDQARTGHRQAMAYLHRQPVAAIEDISIDASLAGRLYRPAEQPAARTLLVYFHGGGFYLGDVDSFDPVARVLANATGSAIFSIGYRLAPEHPFPAAVEDAYAATRWAGRHAAEYGFDRVGVAGDSAGANLATAAALLARAEGAPDLAVQVLVYGVYDLTREPVPEPDPDGLRMASVPYTEIVARYLAGADPHHPCASPLLADDLTGLPPTVIAHAEYDRLRAQGGWYAERLHDAGVPVTELEGRGLDHAYLAWGQFARRPADEIAEIGQAVRSLLG